MDMLDRLLESSDTISAVTIDPGGRVRAINAAFARLSDLPREDVIGEPVTGLLTDSDVAIFERWLQDDTVPDDRVRLNFVGASSAPFTLDCLVAREGGGWRIVGEPDGRGDHSVVEELMQLNNEFATMARERARRERELERTRQRLQAALDDLETSYWHLKKIQEVLPLCMRCGKVKTTEAEWQSVVEYLKANKIFLSHGYCPPCSEAVMADLGLEDEPR